MTYATIQFLLDRYGDEIRTLAHDDEGALDEGKVTLALEDASQEIDTYIGHAYSLPMPTVPGMVRFACCDLAVYNLARGPAMREEIQSRYDRQIKWLKMVAEGKVSLGIPTAQTPEASHASSHGGGRRDFSGWSP